MRIVFYWISIKNNKFTFEVKPPLLFYYSIERLHLEKCIKSSLQIPKYISRITIRFLFTIDSFGTISQSKLFSYWFEYCVHSYLSWSLGKLYSTISPLYGSEYSGSLHICYQSTKHRLTDIFTGRNILNMHKIKWSICYVANCFERVVSFFWKFYHNQLTPTLSLQERE